MKMRNGYALLLILISIVFVACQKQNGLPFVQIQNPDSSLLKIVDCENRLKSTQLWSWKIASISQGIATTPSTEVNYEFAKCSYTGKYISPESDRIILIYMGLNKYTQPISLDQNAAKFSDFSGKATTISLPFATKYKVFESCLQDEKYLSCQVVIGYDYEMLYIRTTADLKIPKTDIENLIEGLLTQLNNAVEKKQEE